MKFLSKYIVPLVLSLLTSCTFSQYMETEIRDKTGTIPLEQVEATSTLRRELIDGELYSAFTSKTMRVEYDVSGKSPKMINDSKFMYASIPSSYAFGGSSIIYHYGGSAITKTVVRWNYISDAQSTLTLPEETDGVQVSTN